MTAKSIITRLNLLACAALCIAIISSCKGNSEQDKNLSRLDSLAEYNSVQAMKELARYESKQRNLETHEKMSLALIKYKAEDKSYVLHSSDSTIVRLNDYFQKNGTVYERLQCFYYMGSTYRDIHDYPASIVWYSKAIEYAESNNLGKKDSVILAHIHSQMSDALYKIGEIKEAFLQTQESYNIMQSIGKESFVTLEDMGRAAMAAGYNDVAEKYYKRALGEIIGKNKTKEYIDFIGEHLGFYTAVGKKQDAEILFNIIKGCNCDFLPVNVYSSIATYYRMNNLPDSVLSYYQKAFELEKRLGEKSELARNIYTVLSEKGDDKEAFQYAKRFISLTDSAQKETNAQEVKNAQSQRTLAELREARIFKKEAAQRRASLIAGSIIVVLVLIAVFLLILYINSRRRIRLLTDMERVTARNKQLTAEHKALQDKVVADKQLRAESAQDVSEVRKRLQEIADGPKQSLQPDSWDYIFNAVDKQYPDFRSRLLSYAPKIKNKDLVLLYLMKLGFKQADIARIVKRDPSVIWRKFKRIEESLGESLIVILRDS